MRSIYAILCVLIFGLSSCGSAPEQPTVTEEHPVQKPDSMPTDNTAVADSSNGNANVGMGGGN
ncbi:MAG: hypothetical protein ACXWDO_04130 [Bacteroidia bacterium]